MATRQQLQTKLEAILGSRNVYFQPPENYQMHYPCFRYTSQPGAMTYANNLPYRYEARYTVTYITRDPENLDFVKNFVRQFQMCSHDQSYVSDHLYHEVFDLYF